LHHQFLLVTIRKQNAYPLSFNYMTAETETASPEAPEKRLSLRETKALQEKQRQAATFQGQLLVSLEERAAGESTEARWEKGKFGRDTFHYGDDTALIQWHNEGGTMKDYARMLDLQKGWWRETYFEGKRGGGLDKIGLIAPTLSELLSMYAPDQLDSFSLKKLLEDAGKDPASVPSEYAESDITATTGDKSVGKRVTDLIAASLNDSLMPDFGLEFSNGGGDINLALRLVPKTDEARLSLINGGKPVETAVETILSKRDSLIDSIKSSI